MAHRQQFEYEANIIRGRGASGSLEQQRRFKDFFGISSTMCSILWDIVYYKLPAGCEQKHFLWSLMFLKQYSTETVNSALARADPKTFRKWVWQIVNIIADLQLVSLAIN